MKKGMLFASGIALALGFTSCDDGSARINELEGELKTANEQRDQASLAHQEELTGVTTTYQYKVDSLQYIIDSLTAPKGTTVTKPKPTKPSTTTTTTPTKTEDPTVTKGGSAPGGTGTGVTKGGTAPGDTTKKSGGNVSKGGKTNP